MVKRKLFRFWFVLWPLFLGVFLPYVPLPFFGHLQNLIWGFLYGFGLFLTDVTVGNSIVSKHLIFGFLLWPIMLTGMLFWLSGREMLRGPTGKAAGLVFITSFACLPVYSQSISWLPTYWRLMFVVW